MSDTKIYAYIWFDIEDYITLESNDVVLMAVQILEKYGIPVTTKLVAEKVRFLDSLKRKDVIAALKESCDVGYHTDTHSRHPLVYEYISGMDVMRGAREIERRERRGLRVLSQVFGKSPSCFGHAGTQWCPHYYPFLKKMGIEVYMDSTDIVNIDDSPYWYCGMLCMNNAAKNYILFDRTFESPDGRGRLKRRFQSIHARLRKKGGAISILWHPHTAVNKVFWDVLNFANGKNTPPDKYIAPAQYPKDIKERAIRDFEELVRFGMTLEDLQFISATDATKIYKRKMEYVLDKNQVRKIAEVISSSKGKISFFRLGVEFISPAEAFCALVNFAASFSKTGKLPEKTLMSEPLGPLSTFESRARPEKVQLTKILSSAKAVSAFLARTGHMPARIKIKQRLSLEPSDYLATLAPLVASLASGASPPETIPLHHATMISGKKYVNAAAFRRACTWQILPRSFTAPKILEQAMLQSWTLVPATPKKSSS